MDKSTSPEKKVLPTGTPDSEKIKINIAYFLSHGKLSEKTEIPNKIWVQVITEFLWRVEKYFKYIDGLKTIEQIVMDGEWLNSHGALEITNVGMAFLPIATNPINRKTRGFFIFTLRHSPYKKGEPVNYTNLILTEQGNWVKWEATRLGHSCSSNFFLLSDEELCSLLDATKHSGYSIMDKLFLILYHSRGLKEGRLASIKKLEEEAQQICNRAH